MVQAMPVPGPFVRQKNQSTQGRKAIQGKRARAAAMKRCCSSDESAPQGGEAGRTPDCR